MQIEITPELLDDLKEKAEKATQGEWYCRFVYDRKFTSITTHERRWAGMPGVAEISMTNIDNPVDIEIEQNANAEYIAAANPAVILALIAKIEQLEKESDWFAERLVSNKILFDPSKVFSVKGYNDYANQKVNRAGHINLWRNAAKEAIKSNE